MQFFNCILYASLWLGMVSAFSWKSTTKISGGRENLEPGYEGHNINKGSRIDLEQSRDRANELYASAMLQLKRLEEEPICHRVAAQLLMSNCQGLENINQKDYDLYSGRIQRHYVESLAASLAICDMERSSMVVPDACESFRLPSLLRASQEGDGKLQITQDEVGGCLEGLGKNPSHWLSWTSYRDNCLLICQVARSDIEKDQSILLQKRLVEIMTQFAANLESDLDDLNKHMADHARTADSYFEGIYARAEALKSKVEGAFEIISAEASVSLYSVDGAQSLTDITSSMKSILGGFGDIQRMMQTVADAVMHSNAEMAAAQEQALVATSATAKSRLVDINALASYTEASFERLNNAIDLLIPVMVSMGERQDALDKASFFPLILPGREYI
ncbi:nuclear membrane fusion Kar5 protein [Rutstroemia sp. NJR-2017a BBW]|nr:nuclear membrane fusion Kar5 protein [Rutstroemia sp. NJR-2017a BBW]